MTARRAGDRTGDESGRAPTRDRPAAAYQAASLKQAIAASRERFENTRPQELEQAATKASRWLDRLIANAKVSKPPLSGSSAPVLGVMVGPLSRCSSALESAVGQR